MGLLVVLIFFIGTLPVASLSWWLTPVLLVPFACAVWVLRARVVAGVDGLAVCNGLGVHELVWSDVEGLEVRRLRPVTLQRRGGRALPLTALPRREVPELLTVARQSGRRAAHLQPPTSS